MKKRKIHTPTPEIIEFLSEEFVCIYHPSITVRASFTNVHGDFGITANKVEIFSQDNFEEINTYIKDEKPSIFHNMIKLNQLKKFYIKPLSYVTQMYI